MGLVHNLSVVIPDNPASVAAGKVVGSAWNNEHILVGAANAVLFNDGGLVGLDSTFAYNKTTKALSVNSLLAADGTVSAPSHSFAAETNSGFYRRIATGIGVALGGVLKYQLHATNFAAAPANLIGFASDTTFGALDTAFGRNAAGVIEINNGTAGQFRDLRVRTATADLLLASGFGNASAPPHSFVGDGSTGLFLNYGGTTNVLSVATGGSPNVLFAPTYMAIPQANSLLWYNPANFGIDAGLARNAAGVVEINSGTPGTLRDLKARTLFPNQISGSAFGISAGTGAIVVDWLSGMTQSIQMTGNITISFTNFSTYAPLLRLYLLNTSAGTVTWPAGVVWPGGVVPSFTSGPLKYALIALLTWGGSTILANAAVY